MTARAPRATVHPRLGHATPAAAKRAWYIRWSMIAVTAIALGVPMWLAAGGSSR